MQGKWDLSQVSCLIVEDHPNMRAILRSVLGGFGIRMIHEATDGAHALEMVLDRRPDIILCDWVMQPFSGSEFLRILRSDHDFMMNTTPVLVISAHSNRSTIVEAVNIGIHGFVAKPVSPSILYNHIGEILHRQMVQGRSKGVMGPGRQAPSKTYKVLDLSGAAGSGEEPQREFAALALL